MIAVLALAALGLAAVSPAHAALTAADHHGSVEGARITWDSVVCGRGDVALAAPIPRERVVTVVGAGPVWQDDTLVGLVARAGDPMYASLTTWQPADDPVTPPLVADPAGVQQVSVDAHRLEPDAALGWVARIGWTGSPDVSLSDRLDARRTLGRGHGGRRGGAWLRVDAPVDHLAVTLVPLGAVSSGAVAAAIGAAGLVLALLAVVHRALDRSASQAQLDGYLDAFHRANGRGGVSAR